MTDNLQILKIGEKDAAALQKIATETFLETFTYTNTRENMEAYLGQGFSLEKLRGELENSLSDFYFALCDGEIVGYLKLNFGSAQTEIQDSHALEIERIYVLKAFHGKKVGQFLYDFALEIALGKQLDYIWLGVWEKNFRALRFYEKNGFVVFDQHAFVMGDDLQTDLMMKKRLPTPGF